MRSFFLTGANRGLGKKIHDVLVSAEYADDECYFLSRSPMTDERVSGLGGYICADLESTSRHFFLPSIHNESKLIVLINNAGRIQPMAVASQVDHEEFLRSLRVNLFGPLYLAQKLSLAADEIGARFLIFNIGSGAARRPVAGWLAYCVGKASAQMAFDVLSFENANVDVIHFDPGVMDTDMQSLIRSQVSADVRDVEIFQGLFAEGKLESPAKVAREILKEINKVQA